MQAGTFSSHWLRAGVDHSLLRKFANSSTLSCTFKKLPLIPCGHFEDLSGTEIAQHSTMVVDDTEIGNHR